MAKQSKKIISVPRFEKKLGYVTTEARSKLMSKIKGKGTKPEIVFRKALWRKGIRYRIHKKDLPGNPDIVIPKYKMVVFIDGEFWHGYNWIEKKKRIKSNRSFWIPKIERNMQRDESNNMLLTELGYKVVRFWDFQINKELEKCIDVILDFTK